MVGNNGTALVVGRMGSLEVTDMFVFCRFTGILLTDSSHRSQNPTCGYGTGSDIDIEGMQYGIVITASEWPGYKFTNVNFVAAPGLGQAAAQAKAGGCMSARIEINGSSQRGTWVLGTYPPPVSDD